MLILIIIHLILKTHAQNECYSLGELSVYYEPECTTTISLGCNAGGQGQNCRFCGFNVYPPCPQTTVATTISTISTLSTEPTPSISWTSNTPGSTISTNTGSPLPGWENPPNSNRRKYIVHPMKKPDILSDHVGPIPTNRWYQNLLLGKGESIVSTLPIQIKATDKGLVFTDIVKGALVAGDRFVITPFLADWTYQTNSIFTLKKVKNLKELSVSVIYTFLTGTMEIPLVQGMVFTTAIYKGLVPVLSTIRSIVSVRVDNGVIHRVGETTNYGFKFVVNFNTGAFWVIYSSARIAFKVNGNDLTATSIENTILKTALLGTSDISSQFDSYAIGYVDYGEVNYQVNGDEAVLQYVWHIVGSSTTLMYALKHHMDHLVDPQRTGIKAYTIKGEMEAVSGSSWIMKIALSNVSWSSTKQVDSNKREEILLALESDQNLKATAPDPYWFGLELARSARLALIADELGEAVIATNIRNSMKEAIIPWLEGTNKDALKYDTTFGGIVSSDGLPDPGADYGNGYYNDHHFHYGYHVYAIAAIGKQDKEFLDNYSEEINSYVRDYANPSHKDPYFTFTRCKDWFTWHSWAAGLYEFADNRNQESSSEAINAYYAISLLGKALGSKEIDDFGRFLTATEIVSTKAYWQMPSYNSVYPEQFRKNLMVGILWSTKVDYTTFFGGNAEFVHGIQFLPFTPMTEEYLDTRFMNEEKVFLDNNTDGASEDWKGYMIEAKAIVDKENQWNNAQLLEVFHAGSSRTNCYYWIATR